MDKDRLQQLQAESRARQARLRAEKRLRKQRQTQADAKRRMMMRKILEIQRKEEEERRIMNEARMAREIDMKGFFGDGELYTKEELMNPPEGETGRIRWQVWDRMVSECKHMLK